MKAKELIKIGQNLYGDRGWQTRMSAALGVDTSTIRRWIYANSVPGPAALALKSLSKQKKPPDSEHFITVGHVSA